MNERMGVRVEVWPVAADPAGIWLLTEDGDAWRSGPIQAGSEPHREVTELIRLHGEQRAIALLHSTSWRVDTGVTGGVEDALVLTYIAVLGSHGRAGLRYADERGPANLHGDFEYVRELWPWARPLSLRLVEQVGRPPYHAADAPPAPRHIDVLMHAVRHLRFLLDTDVSAKAALDDHWRMHLGDLRPSLAGMYQHALGE